MHKTIDQNGNGKLTEQDIKFKYSQIALNVKEPESKCSCKSHSFVSDKYQMYSSKAAQTGLGLSCGLNIDFADIKPGMKVLDLGSGGGTDAFMAADITGENGYVTGVDFTQEMIQLANTNKQKLNFENVDFVLANLTELPFKDETFDVIMANCVINLVDDKASAFKEIYRVLKKEGSICLSDFMLDGIISPQYYEGLIEAAPCIDKAVNLNQYVSLLRQARFEKVNLADQSNFIHKDFGKQPVQSVTITAKKN